MSNKSTKLSGGPQYQSLSDSFPDVPDASITPKCTEYNEGFKHRHLYNMNLDDWEIFLEESVSELYRVMGLLNTVINTVREDTGGTKTKQEEIWWWVATAELHSMYYSKETPQCAMPECKYPRIVTATFSLKSSNWKKVLNESYKSILTTYRVCLCVHIISDGRRMCLKMR